ncbi:MAG TPA: hypothetical protein VGE12_21820 [Noviherbaspirillum sp.]
MAEETVGEYVIAYSGVPAATGEGWAACVTIYGPSPNPMHRHPLVSEKRVSVGAVFSTEKEAEMEARRVALSMIE